MRFVAASLLVVVAQTAHADDIDVVLQQGPGNGAGRVAWERLCQGGPDSLPPLLRRMKGATTTQANWLRLAFDEITERVRAKDAKAIPIDELTKFVLQTGENGRARRLALELIDELQPKTSVKLLPGWLEDPEFRFDAVTVTLTQAKDAATKGAKGEAEKTYRLAFESSRDLQQARDAAAGLEKLGINVGVGAHLGFLMDWHLIGPFDGGGQKGFTLSYPPEEKVDLQGELTGQGGKKLRWIRYQVKEPSHTSGARHQALINLAEKDALGTGDDAVAYAYTAFTVDKAGPVEFRGAADDNLTVWVNGKKAFAFEEWRNGVRLDRHRFTVNLQAGKNTVLVKVCQTPPPNSETNWEFLLRVVDASGKGIAMKNALK